MLSRAEGSRDDDEEAGEEEERRSFISDSEEEEVVHVRGEPTAPSLRVTVQS